ncbi:MAG: tripartite tricarboxylate transporter substrate binding protein [Gammaproteobacteria bacterium]|nr:tripartite tricarboxylate transporter substrate binding protein [Gammaproteobacteria bacterium]
MLLAAMPQSSEHENSHRGVQHMKRAYFCLAVLSAMFVVSSNAISASAFPDRPIRVVVPNAAGGPMDIGIRKITVALEKALGQPVIVDNKPGGNGFIAAEAVAKAKPDGYTVLMAAVSHLCINPHLFQSMPYNPEKDFTPVTLATGGQPILLVSTQLPVKTLSEFVSLAKKSPGKITYGSPAVGSPQHVAMELLEQLTGIDLVHVPYKNSPQILTDVIAGQIDAVVDFAGSAGSQITAGKLRALAIIGDRRKPAFPTIPTAKEAGVAGLEMTAWAGYLVPAGTSSEVVAKLNKAFVEAIRSKDFVEFIESVGGVVYASSAEEFAATIRREHQSWSVVVKKAGLRLD